MITTYITGKTTTPLPPEAAERVRQALALALISEGAGPETVSADAEQLDKPQ